MQLPEDTDNDLFISSILYWVDFASTLLDEAELYGPTMSSSAEVCEADALKMLRIAVTMLERRAQGKAK